MEMILLTDQNVGALWPFIRARLLMIEQKNPVSTLPEEVFASWRSNSCVVHVIELDESPAGVLVVQGNIGDDKKGELLVWALSVAPMASRRVFPALNEWLKSAANHVGASSVTMRSHRMGWEQLLSGFGWKPSMVEYKLEVNRG
jgi:hypothetical protein